MRPVCGLNIRRYVNSIFNSNTYLITYGREAVLVDCGDVLEICHECRDNGIDIKAVLLTHSHFDHIYGLNILLEEFKDITVYTTTVGRESLFSDKLNLSRYHESPFVFEGEKITTIAENSTTIAIWPNTVIKVIRTPGHTPCSLSYLIGNYLFSGDSYIPGQKVVTNLPGGDRHLAKQSISLINSMWTTDITLCPGHGKMLLYNDTDDKP